MLEILNFKNDKNNIELDFLGLETGVKKHVNHSRLKSGACENCPSGATTTICLDTAIACLQVLRTNYQSLYGPQVARRTYYLDTR